MRYQLGGHLPLGPLDREALRCHLLSMTKSAQRSDMDEAEAEAFALAAAVAVAREDLGGIPHDEMRAWLLRVAAGDLDATPPPDRSL